MRDGFTVGSDIHRENRDIRGGGKLHHRLAACGVGRADNDGVNGLGDEVLNLAELLVRVAGSILNDQLDIQLRSLGDHGSLNVVVENMLLVEQADADTDRFAGSGGCGSAG